MAFGFWRAKPTRLTHVYTDINVYKTLHMLFLLILWAMVLSQGTVSPGHIWQCLETCLVVTTEAGTGRGHYHCWTSYKTQESPPPQRMIQPHVLMQGWRSPALGSASGSFKVHVHHLRSFQNAVSRAEPEILHFLLLSDDTDTAGPWSLTVPQHM